MFLDTNNIYLKLTPEISRDLWWRNIQLVYTQLYLISTVATLHLRNSVWNYWKQTRDELKKASFYDSIKTKLIIIEKKRQFKVVASRIESNPIIFSSSIIVYRSDFREISNGGKGVSVVWDGTRQFWAELRLTKTGLTCPPDLRARILKTP